MKKLVSAILVLVMVVALAATGVPVAMADEAVEINIAHIYAPTHVIGQAAELFAERVNELSNGSITVVVFPSSQLGSESEILQQVEQGALDMTISGGGMYAGYNPAAAMFESLCMFTSIPQQREIIEDLGGLDFFNEVMADSNFHAVGWMTGGARNVLSNKAIRGFDDFRGLNIRVPDNTVFVNLFKTLNCNPTIVAWSEGYTAMQTGMVEAIEAGTETLATANLQEVAKYYTITGHINVTNFCSMNKDSWEALSPAQKDAVVAAMKEATAFQLELAEANEQVYRDQFTDAGIEIINLPEEDMGKLQQAVSGLVTETADQFGFGERVVELRANLG